MPRVPPESISAYSFKSTADDMYELTKHLEIPKVILLGHDWGGIVSYRLYLHHPEVYTHMITICAVFFPVAQQFVSLEAIVQKLPNLTLVVPSIVPLYISADWRKNRYQIALTNPQTEKDLEDPNNREKFLKFLYRTTKDPKPIGNFQVRENMVAGIGENLLTSMFTEKVWFGYFKEVVGCLWE